jgi:hypothetical protein
MFPISNMVVNSTPQNKATMVIAVEVEVENVDKSILFNSNDSSRSSAISLRIWFAIGARQPSRIGLDVIIAREVGGGVEGVECLERHRSRNVFEVVLDRHMFDVGRNV